MKKKSKSRELERGIEKLDYDVEDNECLLSKGGERVEGQST
jgi:hypothetical protein